MEIPPQDLREMRKRETNAIVGINNNNNNAIDN